jgi:hypothetical protein
VAVIAVDWSGRADPGHAERIWVAEVAGGRLVALRNGRTRDAVLAHVRAAAGRHAELTVGFDFAFSLPAWWIREQGFGDVRAVWRWARDHGEEVIRTQPPPFYGAPGSRAPDAGRRFRRTEHALRPAKPVFQLAGAGAVGVGSLRGMPHLAELPGFSVWPFDPPGPHRVVEIYPRALTGPVDKRRWATRHRLLHERFGDQDPVLLERAAGSEDAFDAAVSALVLGAHRGGLVAAQDETERLEGRIWTPGCGADELP